MECSLEDYLEMRAQASD
jgi:hypothetical protein